MIDDNVENRFVLTRTLQRKYPLAYIRECGDFATAAAIAKSGGLSCIVSHRESEMDGIELLRALRRIDRDVPIVMVSGIDRTGEALAAGATRFLNYDEWLRLGTLVDEVLAAGRHASAISMLTFAIRSRLVVGFRYLADNGSILAREVEPHLIGQSTNGAWLLRAHSDGGHTDGGRWETYSLERMSELFVTKRSFVPNAGEGPQDAQIAQPVCRI